MKKHIALAFLTLLFINNICAQNKRFQVRGNIPELENGIVYVIINTNGILDTIGNSTIIKNEFIINGTYTEPNIALLKLKDYNGGFFFMLDGEDAFVMELNKTSSKIKGGPSQTAYNDYIKLVAQSNQQINELKAKKSTATKEQKFRTAFSLQKKIDSCVNDAGQKMLAIVEQNRNTIFSTYIITENINSEDIDDMKEAYAQLTEVEKKLQPAKNLAAKIQLMSNLDSGNAPNFVLPDVSGKDIELYSISSKIKIIDFWASWCGPCRLENPNMVKLYNDFHNKGLNIVSISLDNSRDKWKSAIKKDGLTWIQLSSLNGWDNPAAKLYNVTAVPAIFILDENNHIIAKDIRGEQLYNFIETYLK